MVADFLIKFVASLKATIEPSGCVGVNSPFVISQFTVEFPFPVEIYTEILLACSFAGLLACLLACPFCRPIVLFIFLHPFRNFIHSKSGATWILNGRQHLILSDWLCQLLHNVVKHITHDWHLAVALDSRQFNYSTSWQWFYPINQVAKQQTKTISTEMSPYFCRLLTVSP